MGKARAGPSAPAESIFRLLNRGAIVALRASAGTNVEANLTRQTVNGISAVMPVVMSLLAFALVLFAVTTGWGSPHDEGAGFHIFWLLIAAQAPVGLVFLATADWNHRWRVAGLVALQGAAIVLAFSPVAYFKL